MDQLDRIEGYARGFQHFDRGVKRAGVPGDGDRNIAQLGGGRDLGLFAHHQCAGAHRGIEPDDLAAAKRLHALDRAPFAHRIDFQRALLELRFLPALREILYPSGRALGVVLEILDVKSLGGEETLFDRDPPGPIMGVAVALQSDGARHCFLRLLLPWPRVAAR